MGMEEQTFCVVGLGASGRAAVRLLRARGAHTRAYDQRSEPELGPHAAELREIGAELRTGPLEAEVMEGVDVVVLSPGVPPGRARALADEAGARVVGELELASSLIRGTVVAVSGTNGKSTVTRMLGDILALGERPLFVGGNLGVPLSEAVGTPAAGADGVVVVEVSSFQLETVDRFHAHVAVLLNVTDDHLDRYADFAGYAAAKGRVFSTQTPQDYALVPHGDAFVSALAATGSGRVEHFGLGGLVRLESDALVSADGTLRLPVGELAVTGHHNYLDACAAAAAALLLGAPREHIVAALKAYRGLAHRMQPVVTRGGVHFVDDSKATNVGAVVAALEGFARREVVLIAGGRDKGGSYGPLLEPLGRVGRGVVCIGEAAAKLERALRPANVPIRRAATMAEAVRLAADLAESGDTVLLSPACSSYDMFRDYGQRGEAFAGAARDLRPGEDD